MSLLLARTAACAGSSACVLLLCTQQPKLREEGLDCLGVVCKAQQVPGWLPAWGLNVCIVLCT
jgi:hypothetical protein